MDQKQSFNLSADFLGGFSSIFMNLVFAVIAVYIVILILNFLRDKFITQEKTAKSDDILGLLTILNNLFFVSGFGFVIGNLLEAVFSQATRNHNMPSMNFRGEWDYLTFGIILIFVGIGFKLAKKMLKKDREEKEV